MSRKAVTSQRAASKAGHVLATSSSKAAKSAAASALAQVPHHKK